MHNVGVTFHPHIFRHPDATRFSNPADIVTAKINQHQVLGDFLRIRQQLLLQCQIFLMAAATATGAGNRSNGNHAMLYPGENLRR